MMIMIVMLVIVVFVITHEQYFFGRQKRCLACFTEPSNDDYNNDVSDNCDHNYGTFDDVGVKNDQQVSHNMILMSKYKGQHGGMQCPKENIFFYRRACLTACNNFQACMYEQTVTDCQENGPSF